MMRMKLWLPTALLFAFIAPVSADQGLPAAKNPEGDAVQPAPKVNPKPTKGASKARERALAIAKRRRQEKRWPVGRPERTLVPPPALGDVPFPEGERLSFSIKMFNAEAGTATLEVGKRSTFQNTPAVTLRASLKSSPFLAKFYPIDDRLEVLADERTFLPLRSSFQIKENGKEIGYETRYYQIGRRIRSTRNRKGRKLTRSFRPVGRIYEALSSVYAARRLEMKPGVKFEYYIWDGRRERLVVVEMLKKERVWTPVGWFDAMRMSLTTQITGGFIKESDLKIPIKKGTAWIGLDPYRTPLKLITPTKLGDAEAILVHRAVAGDKG